MIANPGGHEPTGLVEDDRLRLIFTCCHPALAPRARVALTLRLLRWPDRRRIAAAFLVPETTMAQRITRAKRKIRTPIPFRVPDEADLTARLAGVLAVVYLVFNGGYLATSGEQAVRRDLTGEAIRLGRILHDLLPDQVSGLLALMLLTEARQPSQVDESGELVTLRDRDRGGWERASSRRARPGARVPGAPRLGREAAGQYQLLAAINAVHTDAPEVGATDWAQIAALYDQLYAVAPSPWSRSTGRWRPPSWTAPAVALAEGTGSPRSSRA